MDPAGIMGLNQEKKGAEGSALCGRDPELLFSVLAFQCAADPIWLCVFVACGCASMGVALFKDQSADRPLSFIFCHGMSARSL